MKIKAGLRDRSHRNASVRATCAWVSCGRVACTNQSGDRVNS